ncbi:MAG: hypothetical protein ACREU6_07075, partial [Steroidobacteraceae bacterium]
MRIALAEVVIGSARGNMTVRWSRALCARPEFDNVPPCNRPAFREQKPRLLLACTNEFPGALAE